jgi:alkylresorcinol/alkylpyrone synthase
MATLIALERYVPPHRYEQESVEGWVREWLREAPGPVSPRLLSVYASAGVRARASVVPIEEVFHAADFEAQNRRYREIACTAGIELARCALASAGLAPGEVDFLVSVSCTGFMIPAVDAFVADALGMGPHLGRLPITEAGCAGGVVALARVADTGSVFFPGTTHLMGFDLRNQGLHIVLDRQLAPFVRREVVSAVDGFLTPRGLRRRDIGRWILHPGGRRIIEVMAERLELTDEDLAPTEAVLAEHGNMSSVTVLFVLHEILRRHRPAPGTLGLLGAFGPGFAAELALLEFR